MKKDLIEVDVGVGLSDSELIAYSYRKGDDKLVIELEDWNANVIRIYCKNPLFFIDRGCDAITMFCERTSKSNLLEETLKKNYDGGNVPDDHPYKAYLLLDLEDEPSIEIICKGVEICKL